MDLRATFISSRCFVSKAGSDCITITVLFSNDSNPVVFYAPQSLRYPDLQDYLFGDTVVLGIDIVSSQFGAKCVLKSIRKEVSDHD